MSELELQRTIGSIEESIRRIDKKIDDANIEHTSFHKRMDSKFDGFTKQHYQWIEEKSKEDRAFATREVNELKKYELEPLKLAVNDIKTSHSDEEKDKRKFNYGMINTIVSGIIGFISAWITITFNQK